MPQMKILETLEKQYRRMRREYPMRKRIAESRVTEWTWASKPFWNINPLYFELDATRPGRKLKKEPAEKTDKCCIGTDAEGRVTVERYYERLGIEETFYDWEQNPVEIAEYCTYRDGEPTNLHAAKFVRGRLSVHVTTATGGATVERYHWDDDQLTSIDIRYAPRDGKSLCRLEPYQTVRADYTNTGFTKNVWIDWVPWESPEPYTEHVYRRRIKPVELDLRPDTTAICRLIEKAVKKYARLHHKDPDSNPPASRFDIIYSLGDSHSTPWIIVNVDTKPGSEPDGDPTHPNFAELYRQKWLPAVQAAFDDQKVPVTLPNGRVLKCNSDKLDNAIGKLLVAQVLAARDEGVFEGLPRLSRCELGVQNPTTFDFGWPNYRDRGKRNLA